MPSINDLHLEPLVAEKRASTLGYEPPEKQGRVVTKPFDNDTGQWRQGSIGSNRDGQRRRLQMPILKRYKNQTTFVQLPFHAYRRPERDAGSVSNQRNYEGWFGRCHGATKLK